MYYYDLKIVDTFSDSEPKIIRSICYKNSVSSGDTIEYGNDENGISNLVVNRVIHSPKHSI